MPDAASEPSAIEDNPADAQPVLTRILAWFDTNACTYERIEHAPVTSAQGAADARQTPLSAGAKAIVLKFDQDFGVFVLNAALQVRSARIRRGLRVRRTRFATREELQDLTGLSPGAVPPFGRPIFDLPLYVDPSVLADETMVFTAGCHQTSLRLATADYRRLVDPKVFPFSR